MPTAPQILEKGDLKGKAAIYAYLIKETIDGIPFYYKGFRSVINKTKKKQQTSLGKCWTGTQKSNCWKASNSTLPNR